ncbi:ranBP-type and C3HC4-type zinc finger-containing protein 1-like [Hydra vulgaris]|uniref:RanBP-type and C3HC4-type zinc finger-containing protein 1-like n=1 Tax=Hydra vulgaris TaxID=6087 RepID=A0ABM4DK86_HYDVU
MQKYERKLCIGKLSYYNQATRSWQLFCDNDELTSIILNNVYTISVMSEKDQSIYGTITFSGFLDCQQQSHDHFQLKTASGLYKLQVLSPKDVLFVKTFFTNLSNQLENSVTQEIFLKPNGSYTTMQFDNHIYNSLEFENESKTEKQVLTNNQSLLEMQQINQDTKKIVNQNLERNDNNEICEKIKNAVEWKNVVEAKRLVEMAAKRGLKLSIHVLNEKYLCNEFSIHVQIVDKCSLDQGKIIIQINPFVTTVSMLKFKIAEEYEFPFSCQRWIINDRVVKDHELLSKSGVQHSGTVIFLYLISKFESKIHQSIQTCDPY